MKHSPISVIIATYNSEDYLEAVIKSVKKQNYPQEKIEILVVDGGSIDKTIDIAKKFKCKILRNKKTLQVFGKQIGSLKAKGKYLVFLDSDEILVSKDSFNKKIQAFISDKRIKAVLPSGYITPIETSSSNFFVNEFGDPFSHFMYDISINPKYFLESIGKIARKVHEDNKKAVFDFSKAEILPMIELSAIGVFVDRAWLLKTIPKIRKYPALISHSFYYLCQSKALLGVTKSDFVLHYSVASWTKYLRKIRSRIINNVYKTEMGMSAFSGRDKYYPLWFRLKKYIFIPYSFSFIFPLIEGVRLSFSRKNIVFMFYPFLCLYTAILILFYYSLKFLGAKNKKEAWGA